MPDPSSTTPWSARASSGLAHAYHLARRGRRVVVFERRRARRGRSVRNFGMLWPIGQPAGPLRRLALRSLRDLARRARATRGLWHEPLGSLHLAYHDDEARGPREFAARCARGTGFDCELLGPDEVRARSPVGPRRRAPRRRCSSPTEVCVDPREVVAGLPGWLAEALGVDFEFGRAVVGFDRPPGADLGDGDWAADRLWVCSGDDLRTLYPEVFRDPGLVRCKLQMLRTEPLAGGLAARPDAGGRA